MSTQTAPFEYHQPAVHAAAPATRAEVQATKAQVAQLWSRGREARLQTGEALSKLRELLSRKGHGTYGEALKELGIKRSTASDYIRFYRESLGLEIKKSRMSGTRTFKNILKLKDAVAKYLRQRPEDVEEFRKWVSDNYRKS